MHEFGDVKCGSWIFDRVDEEHNILELKDHHQRQHV